MIKIINREIYPKTKRIPNDGVTFVYTEKLDGANLVFFKKDGKLHVCQRKHIFTLDEMPEMKGKFYRGLEGWLNEYGKALEDELIEGSAVCGEWLGMGHLKYPDLDKRWYMFAKANINVDYNLVNIKFDHDLFIYPFNNTEIPSYLGVVPVIYNSSRYRPSKVTLDLMYGYYCMIVNRPVEGIVINYDNTVLKYVRYKNGKKCEYNEDDHKGA